MADVGQQVTGTANVDTEVGTTSTECSTNTTQNASRIDLVVDRIERCDEVEAPALFRG